MKEIKSVGILSFAKVSAVIGLIVGFIAGLIITVVFIYIGSTLAALGSLASSMSSLGGAMSGAALLPVMIGMGMLSIIIMPILGAIFGFISGAIWAFFYNVAAKYVGGLKIDL